ncbi:MAG: two-component system, NtrC family, nitrogen regulation sensor histidine kinase GlnL, partial [Alphaproteobacteria bacterium]|nr:two-component system, NtrC family, nitrogen regulation sensor histidine kinase GlnL [Alphaproteobacteria bacterium]
MLFSRKLMPVPDMRPAAQRQDEESSLAANASQLLAALPTPLLTIAHDGTITDVNAAAEAFFEMGRSHLRRLRLDEILPFGSPVLALIDQARARGAAINEYQVDLGMQKIPGERRVDMHVAPMPDERDGVVLMLQERTIAHKMDR